MSVKSLALAIQESIYPKQLELKIEHKGFYASFLNLDTNAVDGEVIKYMMKEIHFNFLLRMPHIDSNIPNNIFNSAFVDQTLRIACSTLHFSDFLQKKIVYWYPEYYSKLGQ